MEIKFDATSIADILVECAYCENKIDISRYYTYRDGTLVIIVYPCDCQDTKENKGEN